MIKISFIILSLLNPITSNAQESSISNVLNSMTSSNETLLFVTIIIALTIYFSHIKYDRFSLTYGPEILTTTGILGCFIGIALALVNFDPNDIQKSIPSLIDGVKTAFWSSVFGVMGALYLRYLHRTKKPITTNNTSESKVFTIEDLALSIDNLNKGLIGEEQGTLLSQIKLMRQESKDKMDEMISAFKDFSSHMVENNQKAIIEALSQIIKDFNNQLTEQFGENFKNLNQAVEKLVVWQQQYKDELEVLKKYQEKTAQELSSASVQFSEIVENSKEFSRINDDLKQQLLFMKNQGELLFQQEKSLAELLTTMKDITPELTNKLQTMISEISSGVQNISKEIEGIVSSFGAQITASNTEFKTLLTKTINDSQKEISDSMKEQVGIIKEGVLSLDKALQKELNDSLETLGRQLASLSNKFVEDYTPLTEKLRTLVDMTKGL